MEESQSTPASPKVSVIVHSYNNAAGLRRCLTALESAKSRETTERIVIDAGSTDGSASLDLDFPEETFLKLPRNFGATKALNIGMRTAKGEYFFFLTPEMEVMADVIPALSALLDEDQDAAACVPVVQSESGSPAGDWWRLPALDALKKVWRDPNALTPMTAESGTVEYAGRSALMVRRFFVRGLNYFDERFGEFGADLDLAYQIRRSGKRIRVADSARVIRHPRPDLPKAARSIVLADRANGVSTFLSKHAGGALAGTMFQVGATLGSLLRFDFPVLIAVAGGSKIDGSQSSL